MRHAQLVAATAFVTMVAPGTARIASAQSTRPPTVAVMYFNNSSLVSHDDYEAFRAGLADILITELQANPGIIVVERDALQKILQEQNLGKDKRLDPETSTRIGKILGAQHMIVGGFLIDAKGRVRLDARAVNVESSRVEYVETVNGSSDDLLGAVATLARKLNDGMHLPGRPAAPAGGRPPAEAAVSTATGAAKAPPFKALLTYARALTEDDSHNRTAAAAYYRQFLDETPADFAVQQRTRAAERLKALNRGSH
jgi:TolB-like protein